MGKEVSFDRKKGNCLFCHMTDDGASPGDPGPPLIAMQARFPDAPPFGKHQALSEKEIDAIVEYLYTL